MRREHARSSARLTHADTLFCSLLAEAFSPAAHEADTTQPSLTLGEGKLADVRLDALPLKPDSLHHIIHHGNCEHAWRIEGIR
jgi:hypothetical protein